MSSTRVVATTVGPYAIHGRELAAACVEHGTDSCDLTGEPQFVLDTIARHHARARETGARIVNCCGFDSIPSDLGVHLLQKEMAARHGTRCGEVKYFLTKMRGGFSGGTAASALHIAEQMSEDPAVRRMVANPYALDPDRRDRGPDGADQRGVRWDPDFESWTGPFMMAAINTRIVRRSNALLGYSYGKDFRYSECQAFARGPGGFLGGEPSPPGSGLFLVAAALGPLAYDPRLRAPVARGGAHEGAAGRGLLRREADRHRRARGGRGAGAPRGDGPRSKRSWLRRDGQDALGVRGQPGEGRPPDAEGGHPQGARLVHAGIGAWSSGSD